MEKHFSPRISVVILLTAGVLSASTVTPLSLKEISTRAHRVTIGKIERITSYKDNASGRIVSHVEVAESHALSGAPSAGFAFDMVGGTAGGIRQWIAGFPSFQVGDRVVLFLAEDTATPLGPTVGLWQGVFFLDGDTVTNHARRPVADIRGEDLVLAETARDAVAQSSASRLSVDSFLDHVRTWRQR